MQQHYLPRGAYLEFFEIPDRLGSIYFYQRGKDVIPVGTHNVAKEKDLYSFIDNDGKLNSQVETGLSEFEGHVKPLLTKLNEEREPFEIALHERNRLMTFVSLQASRTPTFREMLEQNEAQLRKMQLQAHALSKEGLKKRIEKLRDAGYLKNLGDFNIDELREFVLDDTRYTVKAKGSYFLAQQFKLQDAIFHAILPKRVFLLRCDKEIFITSDHPVLRLGNPKIPKIYSGGFRFSDILLPIGRNTCLVLETECSPEAITGEDQRFMIAAGRISPDKVRQINKMTMYHAEKYLFASIQNDKIKSIFDKTSKPTRFEFNNPFALSQK